MMTDALANGTVLKERYTIIKVLGRGGTGIVYQCEDMILHRDVAVKEVFPSYCVRIGNSVYPDTNCVNADVYFQMHKNGLRTEADLLASLSDSLLGMYDSFEENGTLYMVMELVNGNSLRRVLREYGRMPEEYIRNIALGILQPIKALHKEGILYRDLCTDNVLIEKKVRLIDYGSVCFLKEERQEPVIIREGFSPPEQYSREGKYGPWTDLYALGAVMYEMATLVRPPGALERVKQDTLAVPEAINSELSDDLSRVIRKALSLAPEERYQTAEEFEKALIRDGESTERIRYLTIVLVFVCMGILFLLWEIIRIW